MKNLKYFNMFHVMAIITACQLIKELMDNEDKISDVYMLVIFTFCMLSSQIQSNHDKLADMLKESKEK